MRRTLESTNYQVVNVARLQSKCLDNPDNKGLEAYTRERAEAALKTLTELEHTCSEAMGEMHRVRCCLESEAVPPESMIELLENAMDRVMQGLG